MPTPKHNSHLVFCLIIKCVKEHTQPARRYYNTEFYPIKAIAVGFFIFTVNLWSYIIWLYNFIFYHENVHSCIRINITKKIYRYFDGINFNYCFINTTFKKMLLFVNCTENHFYPKKNDGQKHQLFQSRFLEEKYIKQNYLSEMTLW